MGWSLLAFAGILSTVALFFHLCRTQRRYEEERADLVRRLAQGEAEKERLLQEEQARRRTLFDGMVEGVLLLDPSGNVVFINLALKRLLGLQSEMEGKNLMDTVKRPELLELHGIA
jgi:PAS domain-containing protein